MVATKQMNIKNKTYYFYNDLINIKNFDVKFLKLDKKASMALGIYYITYVTKKSEYNVNSVNPLYYLINWIYGFIEEKEDDKELIIALTDKNSEVLKKYQKFGLVVKTVFKKQMVTN